jgi:hypothetical protein
VNTVLSAALLSALVFAGGSSIAIIHGSVRWISSGGDKGKVEGARNTYTAAILVTILAVITIGVLELFGVALVPDWTSQHPPVWLMAAAVGAGPILYLASTALLASVPVLTRPTRAIPRRRTVIRSGAAARQGVAALVWRWSRDTAATLSAWYSTFGASVLHWLTQQVTWLAAQPLPAAERRDFIESQRSNMHLCQPVDRARNLLGMLSGCVRMGMIRRRRLARLNEAVTRMSVVTEPRTRTPDAARHSR